MLLQPSDYFDLDGYEHNALFEGNDYVWEALNKLEAYFKTYAFSERLGNYPGVTFVNPESIYIGPGTTVEAGAYIEGPCIIGRHCSIRHAAYIRKNVIAGDDCVIGHCTELKNVILLNKAHIAHLSYAGDSIFGNHCNLGAGVKCANLKFDDSPVVIFYEGQQYPTHLRKLGAIVGDHAQLGCNSVTNPGTLIGKKSFLYPCTNFGGVVPENSYVRLEYKPVILSKN